MKLRRFSVTDPSAEFRFIEPSRDKVQWKDLPENLQAFCRRMTGEFYSSELIERSKDFANIGTTASFLTVFDPVTKYEDESAPPPSIRRMQRQLVTGLAAIATGQVSRARLRSWQRQADGVRLSYSSGTMRYQFEHPGQLFAQVLLWLVDGKHSRVARCRLPSCKQFFVIGKSKTGGRPRRYCTHEHMLEANKATVLERVNRWRQRQQRVDKAKHK